MLIIVNIMFYLFYLQVEPVLHLRVSACIKLSKSLLCSPIIGNTLDCEDNEDKD